MLKRKFIFMGTVLFMLSLTTSSFSEMEHAGHLAGSGDKSDSSNVITKPDQKKAIEVNNKICPVMGKEINENSKVTYEYEGKIYNLCCLACIEEFKNDPRKYIQIIEEGNKVNPSDVEEK